MRTHRLALTIMARLADVIIVRSFLRPIPARRLGLVLLRADDA